MQWLGTEDVVLMIVCYGYVMAMIKIADRMVIAADISLRSSRKFLHAMIGNLVLVIPFFTWMGTPVLIAAPFILVTLTASPYSPSPGLRVRLKGLYGLTEEGHGLGLVFYSISYTVLAIFFPGRPYVVAAGILPMAYGDSAAALVGRRYGGRRLANGKTLEGIIAMFAASFTVLIASLAYFSRFYPFALSQTLLPALVVSAVVAVVEFSSPRGLDNIAVPLVGALTFFVASGGL